MLAPFAAFLVGLAGASIVGVEAPARASPCSRIWPLPSAQTCGARTVALDPRFAFSHDTDGNAYKTRKDARILLPAFARFAARIAALRAAAPDVRTRHPTLQPGAPFPEAAAANLDALERIKRLRVVVTGSGAGSSTAPHLGANESYALAVGDGADATLSAPSVWGALHGLESFFQLLTRVGDGGGARVVAYAPLRIADAPRWPWRGLLVDTARHFLPLAQLKRVVDGLAALKLNVLHWHVVDAQSWPLASQRFPRLHERGAWSRDAVYSRRDVGALVEHARLRGVRVVPEIDLPAHVGAVALAYPQHVVACAARVAQDRGGVEHGVDKVVLDLAAPAATAFAEALLEDVLPLFIDAYVHLGGDEVDAQCLAASPAVQRWRDADARRARLGDASVARELQRAFTTRVLRMVEAKLGRRAILWDDAMGGAVGEEAALPPSATLQIWRGWLHPTAEAESRGHDTIASVDWYLDYVERGFGDFYAVAPRASQLGGEAASWSEHADEANVEHRVFGRLPAVAERLWSARRASAANRRFRWPLLTCELKRLGLRVAAPVPNFCGGSHRSGEGGSDGAGAEGAVAALHARIAALEKELALHRTGSSGGEAGATGWWRRLWGAGDAEL
jgi:hexosaminidase